MDLLEGGIRVPTIVRWPARVNPGGVSAQHAVTMDWVATFLDVAGIPCDSNYPLDGISLAKNLKNPGQISKRDLFWKMLFRNQKAMRSGDWKYLSVEGNEFLFNLSRDERERANFARRRPEIFEAMKAKYLAWEGSLPSYPDASYSVIGSPAELAHPA